MADSEGNVRGGSVASPDGTRISYLAIGRGPRVLYVHGGLGTGLYWRAGGLAPGQNGVTPHLEDRYESVLMDRRGHGSSDWGHGPHAIEREAEDVLAVLDAVGPVATVVGHSYGATVTLEAALQARPETIGRLVLYEPASAIRGPVLPGEGFATLSEAVASGAYDDALEVFLTQQGAPDLAALRASPVWPVLCTLAPTLVPTVAAVDRVTSIDRYRAVSLPTLLLLGSESAPEQVAAVRALDEALDDSSIVALEGHGHYAISTGPQLVADAIAAFLAAT